MSLTKSGEAAKAEQPIREQAREYLHKVAHHDDNNYGNVFVIEGARIDGETALDMAELALLTQKPIGTVPAVTVAQALDLARRVHAIEQQLSPPENAVKAAPKRTTSKGGGGENPEARRRQGAKAPGAAAHGRGGQGGSRRPAAPGPGGMPSVVTLAEAMDHLVQTTQPVVDRMFQAAMNLPVPETFQGKAAG